MENLISFKQEIDGILTKIEEELPVKDYTYSILSLVWSEFCITGVQSFTDEDFTGVVEELEQLLEVLNPALVNDMFAIGSVLKAIEKYKNSTKVL